MRNEHKRLSAILLSGKRPARRHFSLWIRNPWCPRCHLRMRHRACWWRFETNFPCICKVMSNSYRTVIEKQGCPLDPHKHARLCVRPREAGRVRLLHWKRGHHVRRAEGGVCGRLGRDTVPRRTALRVPSRATRAGAWPSA